MLRNIGLVLATAGATILTVSVVLSSFVVTYGGYAPVAGGVKYAIG